MKLPTPQDLGLPEQFEHWRLNQDTAIETAMTQTKRVNVTSAPTGFGKEVLCVADARLADVPTAIVTASRGLMDQYTRTYKNCGMVDLRGRNNYTCSLKADPDFTCADGYNARCPYKGTHMCPSSQAEMRAAASKLVVTNYDKWIASRKFGMGLNHIQKVIFDEGHEASEALARALQVTLHHKEIEETLGVDFLDGSDADDFKSWKTWAIDARTVAEQELIAARSRVVSTTNPKTSWIRHYTHMRNLLRRLNLLATAAAKDWVVDQVEGGYQFDPIRPGKYVESYLLLRVPKISFVSATIIPKNLYTIGIGKEHFTYNEYESGFDVRRCPVYYIPTMRVEYGRDLSMLWVRLDQIIASRAARLNRNGIVQTVSFTRQQQIYDSSRFADRMLINEKGEPPTQMIEEFLKWPDKGLVFVGPSIGTGYNFPDSACRWNFLCKIPFEPPSKIQKARQAEDKEYVYHRAMQTTVQNFGRDVRSNLDWSERFIGDEHWEWFYPRYRHLAPKSFHAVVKKVDVLPRPLMM